MGRCVLAPLSPDEYDNNNSTEKFDSPRETRHLVIPFQNEYLYAAYVDPSSASNTPQPSSEHQHPSEEVITSVPDLISILGADGEALGSPELRYGLKVRVIGMPAHPLWTDSPQGLKIGGPEYFGLGFEWKRDRSRITDYVKPRSVIDEFDVRS